MRLARTGETGKPLPDQWIAGSNRSRKRSFPKRPCESHPRPKKAITDARIQSGQVSHMGLGHNQEVPGIDRLDVRKGHNLIISIHHACCGITLDNLTEHAHGIEHRCALFQNSSWTNVPDPREAWPGLP